MNKYISQPVATSFFIKNTFTSEQIQEVFGLASSVNENQDIEIFIEPGEYENITLNISFAKQAIIDGQDARFSNSNFTISALGLLKIINTNFISCQITTTATTATPNHNIIFNKCNFTNITSEIYCLFLDISNCGFASATPNNFSVKIHVQGQGKCVLSNNSSLSGGGARNIINIYGISSDTYYTIPITNLNNNQFHGINIYFTGLVQGYLSGNIISYCDINLFNNKLINIVKNYFFDGGIVLRQPANTWNFFNLTISENTFYTSYPIIKEETVNSNYPNSVVKIDNNQIYSAYQGNGILDTIVNFYKIFFVNNYVETVDISIRAKEETIVENNTIKIKSKPSNMDSTATNFLSNTKTIQFNNNYVEVQDTGNRDIKFLVCNANITGNTFKTNSGIVAFYGYNVLISSNIFERFSNSDSQWGAISLQGSGDNKFWITGNLLVNKFLRFGGTISSYVTNNRII